MEPLGFQVQALTLPTRLNHHWTSSEDTNRFFHVIRWHGNITYTEKHVYIWRNILLHSYSIVAVSIIEFFIPSNMSFLIASFFVVITRAKRSCSASCGRRTLLVENKPISNVYYKLVWNKEASNESNLHLAPVGPLRSPHQAFSGAKCCNDKTPKTQRFLATSTWNHKDFLNFLIHMAKKKAPCHFTWASWGFNRKPRKPLSWRFGTEATSRYLHIKMLGQSVNNPFAKKEGSRLKKTVIIWYDYDIVVYDDRTWYCILVNGPS